MKELTVKEALKLGYTGYFYDSDGFQSIKELVDGEVDFSRNDLVLADKETYNPTGMSAKDIAEYLADYIEDYHKSESGDDTLQVYHAIIGLDFTQVEKMIDSKLAELNYTRSSGIRLIP